MRKIIYAGLLIILCMGITGCAGIDYKKAVKLQEQGEYDQALELYNGISDYKDAKEKGAECQDMVDVIKAYTDIRKNVEDKNTELDNAVAQAIELIDKKQTPLDGSLIQTLENAISDAKAAKQDIPDKSDNIDEMRQIVETLKQIDYTDVLENLSQNQINLERSSKQYELVDHPDEKYIISCLKNIDVIKDIAAVTEENDPNGHLNKSGGYTAQIYFSCEWVDQSEVSGDTVIDKGTDCGGSIEVYATAEEAETRRDYLAGFDGGILASGSHIVVGTVLVRTSDYLTASQQQELEKLIVEQLTKVE